MGLTSRSMPNGKGLLRNLLWRFCCKEGSHYCIEQSARNPLEREQVQRAIEKSSGSYCQTSNNKLLFTSLEIPWGFLAQAVLHCLSRGLCQAKKCQFEDFMWEEKVWFAITQWTFAWETFGKRGNGERKPVLLLVPGSHKRHASRKCIMCAINMGAHVWRGTRRTKDVKKLDEKSDSCAAEKGAKELVSSDWAKILEKQ